MVDFSLPFLITRGHPCLDTPKQIPKQTPTLCNAGAFAAQNTERSCCPVSSRLKMCRESIGCAASSAGKQSLWDQFKLLFWVVFCWMVKTLTSAVLGGFGLWQICKVPATRALSANINNWNRMGFFPKMSPTELRWLYGSTFLAERSRDTVIWFPGSISGKHVHWYVPYDPSSSMPCIPFHWSAAAAVLRFVRHRSKTLRLKMRSKPLAPLGCCGFWLTQLYFTTYLRKLVVEARWSRFF